jgi:hypothetical protein
MMRIITDVHSQRITVIEVLRTSWFGQREDRFIGEIKKVPMRE